MVILQIFMSLIGLALVGAFIWCSAQILFGESRSDEIRRMGRINARRWELHKKKLEQRSD